MGQKLRILLACSMEQVVIHRPSSSGHPSPFHSCTSHTPSRLSSLCLTAAISTLHWAGRIAVTDPFWRGYLYKVSPCPASNANPIASRLFTWSFNVQRWKGEDRLDRYMTCKGEAIMVWKRSKEEIIITPPSISLLTRSSGKIATQHNNLSNTTPPFNTIIVLMTLAFDLWSLK